MSGSALERFEAALESALSTVDAESPLRAQVDHHFALGMAGRRGKRLRPQLVLAVAEAEGGSPDDALDAAVAIEILHNYSLVHDDIEDTDRLRHGRETVWAKFGVAHGINVGDALSALSYLSILRSERGEVATRAAMARTLHEANFAMCAGQALDIAFETARIVTMPEYLQMIRGKTAALFGAATELGALAAGCDAQRCAAYRSLGEAYGCAFQIEDDVLGTWGDSAATGKPSGADIARRKWSFPIAWALDGGESHHRDLVAKAYASTSVLEGATVIAVMEALDALGARPAALEAARAALEGAERIAEQSGIDRDGRVRKLLSATLQRVV